MKTTTASEFNLINFAEKLTRALLKLRNECDGATHFMHGLRKGQARRKLLSLGYKWSDANQIVNDCDDMAKLQYAAQ